MAIYWHDELGNVGTGLLEWRSTSRAAEIREKEKERALVKFFTRSKKACFQ